MTLESDGYRSLEAFRSCPERLKKKFQFKSLCLRPFGTRIEDLDIDFFSNSRPKIITHILERCICTQEEKPLKKVFFLSLAISKRRELLLWIVFLSHSDNWMISVLCQRDSCGETLEFELNPDDINLSLETPEKDHIDITIGGKSLCLRRPTGQDQLDWLKKVYPDETSATIEIIRSLIVNEGEKEKLTKSHKFGAKAIKKINSALEDSDPLLTYNLRIVCPCCKQESIYKLDLEGMALSVLQSKQQQLIKNIHLFAKQYHWNESEILAIPAWRREAYLKLINKE